jgi:hypothetical protein
MKSIWRLWEFWTVPRLYVTGVSAGVVVGSAMSIYTKTVDWIGGPFVWVGCFIVLRRVWSGNLTWPRMFRLSVFWGGLALVVAGNLITYSRAK